MTEPEKFPQEMYVGPDLRYIVADTKIVFFIGFGLLIIGLLGFMVRHPDSGSVVIAGSILMGAAVIGNSISPTHALPDDEGGD